MDSNNGLAIGIEGSMGDALNGGNVRRGLSPGDTDRDRARGGHDVTRSLAVEAEAARCLLRNIRDILADDEDAKADAIEGETNLREAIAVAVDQLADLDMLADGIRQRETDLRARRKRAEDRAANIRTAILLAMGAAEMRKLVLPQATLTVKATPPSVVVTDEAEIPSAYWKRADPTLDRRLLLEALKGGATVAGATLSNGNETLQVRVS